MQAHTDSQKAERHARVSLIAGIAGWASIPVAILSVPLLYYFAFCFGWVMLIAWIVAIVYGIRALRQLNKDAKKQIRMAWIGIILAALPIVAFLLVIASGKYVSFG